MSRTIPAVDPALAFRQYMALRLPSRDALQSAIAHVPAAPAWRPSRFGARYEAPRWFLTISPGTVRVTCRLSTPKERWGHNDEVNGDLEDVGNKRGRITHFSAKSRARMCMTFRSLDYAPMFMDVGFPALVTLTAPGDWLTVFPTPRSFKLAVAEFKKLYGRRWKRPIQGVWKMEFQERGAPHLHILMTPPFGRAPGTGQNFQEWASETWARIVSAPDPEDYANHVKLGVDISWEQGQRYSDPKRIAVYFDKHSGYHEKEYQNVMPREWQVVIAEGGSGPQYWGSWQLAKMQETVELSRELGARMRRRVSRLDYDQELLDAGIGLARHAQPRSLPDELSSDYSHYVSSTGTAGKGSSATAPTRSPTCSRQLRTSSRSTAATSARTSSESGSVSASSSAGHHGSSHPIDTPQHHDWAPARHRADAYRETR